MTRTPHQWFSTLHPDTRDRLIQHPEPGNQLPFHLQQEVLAAATGTGAGPETPAYARYIEWRQLEAKARAQRDAAEAAHKAMKADENNPSLRANFDRAHALADEKENIAESFRIANGIDLSD